MKDLISIIVPCYNQDQFLEETLYSVEKQSYKNWECLIINDGSTDNTEKIAQEFCSKDPRFKYYFKNNGGLSSARNFGLNHALGEFIQFLDSDDFIAPKKFEYQIKNMISENCDIDICDFIIYDDTDKAYSNKYLNSIPNSNNFFKEIILFWEDRISIPCHCILFRRSLIHMNSRLYFNEDLKNHEDWVFWVQLFAITTKISTTNKALAVYRMHPNSMSRDLNIMKLGFLEAVNVLMVIFSNERSTLKLLKIKRRKLLNHASLIEKVIFRINRRIKYFGLELRILD